MPLLIMPRSISLNRLPSSKKKWSLKEVDALYDIYKNNFGTKGENVTPPSPYKKAKKHGSLRRTSTVPIPGYAALRKTSTIPSPGYSKTLKRKAPLSFKAPAKLTSGLKIQIPKTFDDYQEDREKAAARVNAEFMRSI
tara:strand:- start:199 stop:612 length:414 start_codon:yes stop_codon:yes gene_type:complete